METDVFWLLIRCQYCERSHSTVRKRRNNTQYVDDSLNFRTLCAPCFADEEEYWAGMWSEYWASVI